MKKIAILSGKGGVGKTTIAINIALTLKKRGFKVGIMDSDVDCPNVPQIAGLPTNYQIKIKNDKLLPYNWNDIDVISLAWTMPEETPVLWDGTQRQEVIDQIIRLTEWQQLDYLIIDCPAGTSTELFSVLQSKVTGAIIVTTPHAAAVADAKRAKEAITEYKTPLIGIINNMSYINFECPHCKKKHIIEVSDKKDWSSRELLGNLPYSQKILKTNRIEVFDPIVEKILNRLPHLKEIKHYEGKATKIKRYLIKYAIKKTT